MRRGLSSRLFRAMAILGMAGWPTAGPGSSPASGQSIANPVIGDFEIAPAGSLEWDILDRLAWTHRYDRRDLFRLARMTVLESIAMYENLRADLPLSLSGARREGEMSYLWDSAELFYVTVTPSDATSLVRSRPLLMDVEAAYARLDETLAAMPGVSPRAALHLRNIARLLPVMNALIDAMEADLGVPVGVPAAPALDTAALRQQARLLADDLREAARAIGDAKPAPAARDALIADLGGLLDLLQGFDRMLASGARVGEVVESLRLVRSRLWPIEARFIQLARTPELAGRWRPIRQRINAISDLFDRSRVIAPKAVTRPARGVDRRLLAQADRAIAAMDEFLGQEAATAAAIAGGSQYQDDLGRLRRGLLLFRQQVAAGEPAEPLTRSLREIEGLNRRLGERARSEGRIFRGGTRLDTRGLQVPMQAVEKLRELMPKPMDNALKPAP
jgi:hypothetical protein